MMLNNSIQSVFICIVLALYAGCASPAQKEEIKKSFVRRGDALYAEGKYAEAFDYYEEGIPFIPYTAAASAAGSYLANKRVRVSTFGEEGDTDDAVPKISIDSTGEECFYRAMDCQVKLGNYNYVLSQYEKYIGYFPNYSRMEDVVDTIKFLIAKYEEWGKKSAAVRGYKLLLRIDPFSLDGRNAYFAIADY